MASSRCRLSDRLTARRSGPGRSSRYGQSNVLVATRPLSLMLGFEMEHDKSYRGNASQFFVAGELCRRGYAAVVTLGNTPNTDVLCSNRSGTRFAHIQVKTFVPGSKTCSVGLKSERLYGESFFWVLAGIPLPGSALPFRYLIIPCREIANNVSSFHQRWLHEPGKKGQRRNDSKVRAVAVAPGAAACFWDAQAYEDRWDLIEAALDEGVPKNSLVAEAVSS